MFYDRSGTRVNEHTLICWLFITSSLPSVYVQRRIDLWDVHKSLLIVGTKFEYIGSRCSVKILVYERW